MSPATHGDSLGGMVVRVTWMVWQDCQGLKPFWKRMWQIVFLWSSSLVSELKDWCWFGAGWDMFFQFCVWYIYIWLWDECWSCRISCINSNSFKMISLSIPFFQVNDEVIFKLQMQDLKIRCLRNLKRLRIEKAWPRKDHTGTIWISGHAGSWNPEKGCCKSVSRLKEFRWNHRSLRPFLNDLESWNMKGILFLIHIEGFHLRCTLWQA